MEKIYVSIRVRPLSKAEVEKGSPWRLQANTISLCNAHGGAIQGQSFSFDNVFSSDVRTLDIYNTHTKDIIASAVDGFNGTVFAYGQTSSGKTHTMRGGAHEPGIIPLAVQDVFHNIHQASEREFLLRVSYMEIYNEEINDLLSHDSKKLQIHENLEKGIFVAGLKEEIVVNPEQVLNLMEVGEAHRHVGKTNMNEYSSRSHTIFRMVIESRDKSQDGDGGIDQGIDAVRVSTLNLVDLAGSERVAKTGAEGARLKEGTHINKSLMTLGTVINKLSEGTERNGGHIPYRDSKLTRILQSALGGNAKTAIICNVTPAMVHTDETRGTLQFASRAKRVTNCAQVNEVMTDAALLKRQKNEIEELRQKLQFSHSPHLEEEILSLRNALLAIELEREMMALELQEERAAQAERERRIKEQEQKIENLSTMVINSAVDDRDDKRLKKVHRRETWCPRIQQLPNAFESQRPPLREVGQQPLQPHSSSLFNTPSFQAMSAKRSRHCPLPPAFESLLEEGEQEPAAAAALTHLSPRQVTPVTSTAAAAAAPAGAGLGASTALGGKGPAALAPAAASASASAQKRREREEGSANHKKTRVTVPGGGTAVPSGATTPGGTSTTTGAGATPTRTPGGSRPRLAGRSASKSTGGGATTPLFGSSSSSSRAKTSLGGAGGRKKISFGGSEKERTGATAPVGIARSPQVAQARRGSINSALLAADNARLEQQLAEMSHQQEKVQHQLAVQVAERQMEVAELKDELRQLSMETSLGTPGGTSLAHALTAGDAQQGKRSKSLGSKDPESIDALVANLRAQVHSLELEKTFMQRDIDDLADAARKASASAEEEIDELRAALMSAQDAQQQHELEKSTLESALESALAAVSSSAAELAEAKARFAELELTNTELAEQVAASLREVAVMRERQTGKEEAEEAQAEEKEEETDWGEERDTSEKKKVMEVHAQVEDEEVEQEQEQEQEQEHQEEKEEEEAELAVLKGQLAQREHECASLEALCCSLRAALAELSPPERMAAAGAAGGGEHLARDDVAAAEASAVVENDVLAVAKGEGDRCSAEAARDESAAAAPMEVEGEAEERKMSKERGEREETKEREEGMEREERSEREKQKERERESSRRALEERVAELEEELAALRGEGGEVFGKGGAQWQGEDERGPAVTLARNAAGHVERQLAGAAGPEAAGMAVEDEGKGKGEGEEVEEGTCDAAGAASAGPERKLELHQFQEDEPAANQSAPGGGVRMGASGAVLPARGSALSETDEAREALLLDLTEEIQRLRSDKCQLEEQLAAAREEAALHARGQLGLAFGKEGKGKEEGNKEEEKKEKEEEVRQERQQQQLLQEQGEELHRLRTDVTSLRHELEGLQEQLTSANTDLTSAKAELAAKKSRQAAPAAAMPAVEGDPTGGALVSPAATAAAQDGVRPREEKLRELEERVKSLTQEKTSWQLACAAAQAELAEATQQREEALGAARRAAEDALSLLQEEKKRAEAEGESARVREAFEELGARHVAAQEELAIVKGRVAELEEETKVARAASLASEQEQATVVASLEEKVAEAALEIATLAAARDAAARKLADLQGALEGRHAEDREHIEQAFASERASIEQAFAEERAQREHAHAEEKAQLELAFVEERIAIERAFADERESSTKAFLDEKAEVGEKFAEERAQMGRAHTEERASIEKAFAEQRGEMERAFAEEKAASATAFAEERAEMARAFAEEKAACENGFAEERAALEKAFAEAVEGGQAREGELALAVEEKEALCAEITQELVALEALKNATSARLAEVEALFASEKVLAQEAVHKLEASRHQHQHEVAQLRADLATLRKEVAGARCLPATLEKERDALAREAEKTKGRAKETEAKLKLAVQEKNSMQAEKANMERELRQLRGQSSSLAKDLSRRDTLVDKRRESMAAGLSKAKSALSSAEIHLQRKSTELEKASFELQMLQEAHERLEGSAAELAAARDALQLRLGECEQDLEEERAAREALGCQLADAAGQLAAREAEILALRGDHTELVGKLCASEKACQLAEESAVGLAQARADLAQVTELLRKVHAQYEDDKATWHAGSAASKDEVEGLRGTLEILELQKQQADDRLASLNAEIVKVSQGREREEEKRKQAEERAAALEASLANHVLTAQQASEEAVTAAEAEKWAARDALEQALAQLATSRARLAALDQANNELAEAKASLAAELASQQRQVAACQHSLAEAVGTADTWRQKHEQATKEAAQLERQVAAAELQITELRMEVDALRAQAQDLRGPRAREDDAALRHQVADLARDCQLYKEELAQARANAQVAAQQELEREGRVLEVQEENRCLQLKAQRAAAQLERAKAWREELTKLRAREPAHSTDASNSKAEEKGEEHLDAAASRRPEEHQVARPPVATQASPAGDVAAAAALAQTRAKYEMLKRELKDLKLQHCNLELKYGELRAMVAGNGGNVAAFDAHEEMKDMEFRLDLATYRQEKVVTKAASLEETIRKLKGEKAQLLAEVRELTQKNSYLVRSEALLKLQPAPSPLRPPSGTTAKAPHPHSAPSPSPLLFSTRSPLLPLGRNKDALETSPSTAATGSVTKESAAAAPSIKRLFSLGFRTQSTEDKEN